MLNITILAIDKVKEKHFQTPIDEYLKRLKPYARINMVELAAESFSESNREKAKKREGEKILNYLNKHIGQIYLLEERGDEFSSPEFAEFLDKKSELLIFVIGGALGLSEEVRGKANKVISLSAMTFPHEMARMILCEQLYRAVSITKGKNYHY